MTAKFFMPQSGQPGQRMILRPSKGERAITERVRKPKLSLFSKLTTSAPERDG